MEKNQENGKEVCDTCGGNAMTCRSYHMHHHSIVRILVALVILGFVFLAGMKLGELKAEVAIIYAQGDQSSMMRNRMYQGGYGMNPGTTIAIPVQTTTTAPAVVTPAAPATR